MLSKEIQVWEARRPPRVFQQGGVLRAREVPLYLLQAGQRVVGTDCLYWEEATKVVGIVKGVVVEGDEVTVHLAPGHPVRGAGQMGRSELGRVIDLHLCPKDCGNLSKDALVHCKSLKLWTAEEKEGWMDNLLGMGGLPPEPDELARLRRRSEALVPRRGEGPEAAPKGAPLEQASVSSEESRLRKKKKKKERKAKKEKAGLKVSGTKELEIVFGATALDPSPSKRKIFKRRARRLAKKVQEKRRQQLIEFRNLRWEQQLLGGSGHSLRRRGQGEEIPRCLNSERFRADAECSGDPDRATMAAGYVDPPSNLQPILAHVPADTDVGGDGHRGTDRMLCARPPIAGEDLCSMRCADTEAERIGTNMRWRTLHSGAETGAGAHRHQLALQSCGNFGSFQAAEGRAKSAHSSEPPLGEETRVGETRRRDEDEGQRQRGKGQEQRKGRQWRPPQRGKRRGEEQEVEEKGQWEFSNSCPSMRSEGTVDHGSAVCRPSCALRGRGIFPVACPLVRPD